MNLKIANKKNRHKTQHMSDINITPFVDVLLVLLIVFMVAAPLINGAVNVDLPEGAKSKRIKDDKKQTLVSITKDGQILIDEYKTNISSLNGDLLEATDDNLNQKIYVRGDKSIDYGTIMSVIKRINDSGFSKVILVTNLSQ